MRVSTSRTIRHRIMAGIRSYFIYTLKSCLVCGGILFFIGLIINNSSGVKTLADIGVCIMFIGAVTILIAGLDKRK